MTSRKNGSGLPADLEEKLEQARKAAPRKPSTFRYLQLVRGIARDVDSRPDWQAPLDRLRRAKHRRISNTLERLLVEITCHSHSKPTMKDKYTKVLMAARHYDVDPKELQQRIEELGGINEAMRYAPRKRAKKKKSIRSPYWIESGPVGGHASRR